MFNNKSVMGLAVFVALIGMDAKADIVHADDVIVQGSHCVGIDCVNGEDFSFDTIRLKENNLRMHFDDTSASGSFPANDWRIIINDTTNGGASHFSIEDSTAVTVPFRIEATAPSNSLVVDDTGRLGLKTLTPAVEIHSVDGNTPTLRLDQDNSDGWTPQIWDVAGNEANFFVRDVTNGSQLPFRIKPGAPSNSVFVANDGRLGLGTATPEANTKLTVKGGSASKGIDVEGEVLIGGGDNTKRLVLTSPDSTQKYNITLDNNGNLAISRGGSGVTELTLTGSGNIVVGGNLVIQGTCTGCN